MTVECEQCGRKGTRQFKVFPANVPVGAPEIVVCEATKACQRRRWLRLPEATRQEIREREW